MLNTILVSRRDETIVDEIVDENAMANDGAAVERPIKKQRLERHQVDLLITDRNARSSDCSVGAVALPLPFQGKTLIVIAPPSDGVIGFDPDRSRTLARRALRSEDRRVGKEYDS